MATFSKSDPPASSILFRMASLGVSLEPYVASITWMWKNGFDFICPDCKGLMQALILSQHFGCDSAIGGSMHKGVSFREVSQPDSLHIVIYEKHPGAKGDNASIHLDSFSPVAGRDDKTKGLVYDYGKVLQHVVTDAKHKPLIVPSSEAGLVFGLRF